MMFKEPQTALLQEVTDFVFSTWWVNYPPLITATQVRMNLSSYLQFCFFYVYVCVFSILSDVEVQQAWSGLNGVNLLASGIGLSWYNSGSGLYSNATVLATAYNPTSSPTSKLLQADIPLLAKRIRTEKSPQPPFKTQIRPLPLHREHGQLPRLVRDPTEMYEEIAGPPASNTFWSNTGAVGSLQVSEGGVQCSVSYEIGQVQTSEPFGLVAFQGTYGLLNASYCALLRCAYTTSNASTPKCTGFVQDTHALFSSFTLNMTLSTENCYTGDEPLAMVATNNTQVLTSTPLPFHLIKRDQNMFSLLAPTFKQPLLSASLFVVSWIDQ